jgi:hypothetical protein
MSRWRAFDRHWRFDGQGIGGGAVAGGVAIPNVTIDGVVKAKLPRADIDANTMTILGQHTSNATAKGDAIGVGIGTVTETNVDANVKVGTTAELGAANVHTLGGINVTASATATADAKSGQKAVGAGTYGKSPADASEGNVTATWRTTPMLMPATCS